MNARAYDRLAAAVSLILLLSLAAGTYYLAELADRFIKPERSGLAPNLPDAFAEGVVLLRLNEQGTPVFRMSADRMEHFGDSDTTTYVNPRMVTLDPARPRITVTALRGTSNKGNEETRLEGKVQLDRPGTATDPPMRVRTEFAIVLTESEIAHTDRPVVITRGDSTLTGTGMEFNNRARTLRIDADARGLWASEKRQP